MPTGSGRGRPTTGRRPTHAMPRVRPLTALIVLLLFTACGRTGPAAPRPAIREPPLSAAALSARARLLRAQAAAIAAAQRQRRIEAAANWYLARMSLDEQLGQMLINEADGVVYSPDMAIMIERQRIGAVMLFPDNFGAFDQTREMLRQMQAHAHIPLLIATDQEGGTITRTSQYFGDFPAPRELASSGDPQVAYTAGQRTARDLQQLGINTDLAPVVDVPVDGGGGVWGPGRTFADVPQTVARFASAYMHGLQDAGAVSALKHFPGLGSVTVDPHGTLPVVSRTLDQFRQSELSPYQALIPQFPDMIMATDLLVPAVDPHYPAELSPTWITGILRRQLGYDGVVITDSMWMKGISQRWSLPQAALLAVLAGDDLIMAAYSSTASQAVLDTLRAAIASGRISPARIADSARRILMVKITHDLLPLPQEVVDHEQLVSA